MSEQYQELLGSEQDPASEDDQGSCHKQQLVGKTGTAGRAAGRGVAASLPTAILDRASVYSNCKLKSYSSLPPGSAWGTADPHNISRRSTSKRKREQQVTDIIESMEARYADMQTRWAAGNDRIIAQQKEDVRQSTQGMCMMAKAITDVRLVSCYC